MPHRSLVSLLLLLPSVASATQFDVVDEAWARNRTNGSLDASHPIELESTPDGGVLVLALARPAPLDVFSQTGELTLTKLDENGDFEWEDAVAFPPIPSGSLIGGRYADATVTDQGTVYLIWSEPVRSFLRRYDPDGTQVWTQSLNRPPGHIQFAAKSVAVSPTGDVITSGVGLLNAYPRVVARAFAPDATQLWEWRGMGEPGIPALADPMGISIGPTGLVLLNGRSDIPGFSSHGMVIALGSDGTFLWRYDALSGGPISEVAFDSAGNAVVAANQSSSLLVEKIAPNGTSIFSTTHSETGYFLGAQAVAVDSFDRIYVGGGKYLTGGLLGIASLYRFDAAGAYIDRLQPSAVDPGESGEIRALSVTNRNDVVTYGYSGTGVDEIFAARFAPDGSERWSIERRGRRPLESPSDAVDVDLAVDSRGNLFTLAQTVVDGVYPNLTLGTDVVKFVQNGPAGAAYCAPAVANSTGVPGTLAALGPSQVGANNVTLRVDDLPSLSLTLFLASRAQGNAPNAGGGQGTLCLGGSIGRFYGPGQLRTTTLDGTASLQLDLTRLPQPNGSVVGAAGETWNFQAWYRDANPTTTSNFTSAVAVTLQ